MNILLATDSYPPEIRGISFMAQELAEELALRDHLVTVITSWPRYNLSPDVKKRNFSEYEVKNDVAIIRVKTLPHHKVNFILRGISELTLPYFFFNKIMRFKKHRFDALILYSPPLPLTMLGAKMKRIYGVRYLLNVQDIFPQNAIDLGIMKNTLLIKFFEWIESKAYREADRLTSHTEGGRRFLTEKKKVPAAKISTVPNWIDLRRFDSVNSASVFRDRYGLKEKFIFLFAGIMGPSQNLDFIIDIARKVVDIPDICFVFVGDGVEKKRLERMVKEYGLLNVKFQPFVSQEAYPSLVKEVDIGLVCLNNRNMVSVIPGKILGFMAASIPVVAFLNKENDGHELIRKAQCGYSAVANSPDEGAELIKKVFTEKDKFTRYGKNGYNYAAAHFSKDKCVEKIEQLIS